MIHNGQKTESKQPRNTRLLVRWSSEASREDVQNFHLHLGCKSRCRLSSLRLELIEAPPGTEKETLAQYRNHQQVLRAELDGIAHTQIVPNDLYYDSNYPSSFFGPVDQHWLRQIGAPAGWDMLPANARSKVRVAVLDTGVDPEHPDLRNNLARNEQGAVLGLNLVSPGNAPVDDHGHGTHVAGIIAAVTQNGGGVASPPWNRAEILPVKILDADGSGTFSDMIQGIIWAADQGARIINLSLGSAVYSDFLQEAVDYAVQQGVLILAAAGNDGSSEIQYPAGLLGVLGVGAVNSQHERAPFSNCNRAVGISAPGVGLLSTMPAYPVSLNAEGYKQFYDALSGTSMAAPVVAGVAAALYALRPGLSPEESRRLLQQTAMGVDWTPEDGYGQVREDVAVLKLISEHATSGVVSRQAFSIERGQAQWLAWVEPASAPYTLEADHAWIRRWFDTLVQAKAIRISWNAGRDIERFEVFTEKSSVTQTTSLQGRNGGRPFSPSANGSVYGQVRSPEGNALAGAVVRAAGESVATGVDGMFRIANLPAGIYSVAAFFPDGGLLSQDVEVKPESDAWVLVQESAQSTGNRVA